MFGRSLSAASGELACGCGLCRVVLGHRLAIGTEPCLVVLSELSSGRRVELACGCVPCFVVLGHVHSFSSEPSLVVLSELPREAAGDRLRL